MTGAVTVVPPPPTGPGVQPPFVAPPTDGTTRRRWAAAAVAVGVMLALCLGGVGAVGGLVVLGIQVIRDESQASVHDYLNALRDQDYGKAYGLQCDQFRQHVSLSQYEQFERRRARVSFFNVGTANVSSNQVLVPADVDFADGTAASVTFEMAQDSNTGAFEVCGPTV
jgi:hypothetical protein